MKKLFFVLAACLFLCGCSFSDDYLAYQRPPISAELDLEINGRFYSADIFLSEQKDAMPRDMILTFTHPNSLAGVSVKRVGNTASVALEDVEIPLSSDSVSGFLDIADAFSIEGVLDSVEVDDGINILRISNEVGNYVVFLDSKTKTPVRIDVEISGRTIEINIKNFINKQIG